MNDSWASAMGGGYRGGVMACVFFILLLPALYITVSLSEKCHTRVCLQKKRKKEKKAKKNTEMEKKRKWSLVMSGLKNSEERPLAVSGVCVCVCKLCTSKSHAMSTSAANWPSDAMSSRTNRTGREPDRTGQQGQQRHANGAGTPVTWCAFPFPFPFPSPCPAFHRFRGLSNCLQPDWGTQDDTHPSWMHSVLRLNECEPDYDIHLGVGWLCRGGGGQACSESQFCLFCGFSVHCILNCFS